jgi:hypothetical protein
VIFWWLKISENYYRYLRRAGDRAGLRDSEAGARLVGKVALLFFYLDVEIETPQSSSHTHKSIVHTNPKSPYNTNTPTYDSRARRDTTDTMAQAGGSYNNPLKKFK